MSQPIVNYFSIPSWTIEVMSDLDDDAIKRIIQKVNCYLTTGLNPKIPQEKIEKIIVDSWIKSIDNRFAYDNNR
jgi:hypothetical protein